LGRWRDAALAAADRGLCAFAEKLTREQQFMTQEDVTALRQQGFSDAAIHDAAQVIGYFAYITRVADALGVVPESFIQSWELSTK